MKIVPIAGLPFGDGRTKICVPLTAVNLSALTQELAALEVLPANLYEWRADFYEGPPAEALALFRERASRPVLCTLRTAGEGGKAALSPAQYEEKLRELLAVGGFQLLDIELSCGEERVEGLLRAAHKKGLGVILSRHDFHATPTRREMEETLLKMYTLGADLPKLAVMPQSPEDVLALLDVTLAFHRSHGPLITMSMGPLGQLSRVSGGLTGSCLTFAAGVTPSAPGQLPANEIRKILDMLEPLEGESGK